MKTFSLILLINIFLLFTAQAISSELEKYYNKIDYSCNVSSDCVVKDIHNCCGYYPACVNVGAKVDPDKVMKICEGEGLSSGCGFPSITHCECEENKCIDLYKPEEKGITK